MKNSKIAIITASLFTVLGVLIAVLVLSNEGNVETKVDQQPPPNIISPTPAPVVLPPQQPPAVISTSSLNVNDWQSFNDQNLGITFLYPKQWTLKLNKDANGKMASVDFISKHSNGFSGSVAQLSIQEGKLTQDSYYAGDGETVENVNINNISMVLVHLAKNGNWAFGETWNFEHKGHVFHFAETFATTREDSLFLQEIVRSIKSN